MLEKEDACSIINWTPGSFAFILLILLQKRQLVHFELKTMYEIVVVEELSVNNNPYIDSLHHLFVWMVGGENRKNPNTNEHDELWVESFLLNYYMEMEHYDKYYTS